MSELAEIEKISCAFCNGDANQRCTGCHVTFYCSREHQKQHWKKHKTNCCAFKICSSSVIGRHVVATRDLRPGELVLSENPLLIAPMAYTVPICLACFKPVDGSIRCTTCGWPMCSDLCIGSSNHVPECTLNNSRGKPIPDEVGSNSVPNPIYEAIATLRCIYLKQSNPDVFEKLMQLEAHAEKRKLNGRVDKDQIILKMIRRFFNISASLISDDEVLDLQGILFVNSHEVPVTPTPVLALYLNSSLIEHNCVSNASKHFDTDGSLQIRAAVHIRKGDHIAITYSDPMWGNANRQQHLMESKFFQCICNRCQDPLELGTNFSSLRCPSCPAQANGYLSSINPLDIHSPFSCDHCHCEESADYVNAVIRSIGEELVQLEKGNPEACLTFIKKHSQNLHRNHFYLMDVKLALCQLIGKNLDTVEDQSNTVMDFRTREKDLIIKQKLCMELISIANIISPGISRLRGVILYELQSTLAIYARKKFAAKEITLDHFKNIIQEVRRYLIECIQIFSFESECIQEGRLASVARLKLAEVEDQLSSFDTK
eukprot:maker-scaffold953_size76948-snap-gene-0.8 protein:Tk11425 transcript:maker-scaffold953_size76948-snap-gene-0.8-mRNA-1 annotation:"hypothetical protein DAPPUDRAFT_194440"